MHCATKTADILSLLTLTYNEFIIASIFNTLQKLTQVLRLTKKVIREKIIMLKDDLLTVQNAT